jgi:methyl-accepting chemotaxis protein
MRAAQIGGPWRDRFARSMQPQAHSATHATAATGANGHAAPLAVPAADGAVLDLLRRWRELSELERRAFNALARELNSTSTLIEASTLDLSERFQDLAGIAQGQVGRVDQIIAAAGALQVNGAEVPMHEALQSVESVLGKAIETVLFVSKNAMRMVYALEDVARDVAGAEQCSSQIEVINRQARYLALNAAIEATRSGAAGSAFNVIAREMKQLAQATEQTSAQVRERIDAVTKGVRKGHEVMQEIATLDLSENILAKDRIDALLAGIAAQHGRFGSVLADTATASAEMAGTVGRLITGMQFQDRTKQQIAQVIETLAVLEAATESAQQATDAALPGAFTPGGVDQEALERIIEKQTLGGMKARVLSRLLSDDGGEAAAEDAGPVADDQQGDIELF